MNKTINSKPAFPLLSQLTLFDAAQHQLSGFLIKAQTNKILFINDIPGGLSLKTDRQTVISVLNGILSVLVNHSKDVCIRLSAKIYGNVILLRFSKPGFFGTAGIETELSFLIPLAEKILGSVSLTGDNKRGMAVTFSFPNLPLANKHN